MGQMQRGKVKRFLYLNAVEVEYRYHYRLEKCKRDVL